MHGLTEVADDPLTPVAVPLHLVPFDQPVPRPGAMLLQAKGFRMLGHRSNARPDVTGDLMSACSMSMSKNDIRDISTRATVSVFIPVQEQPRTVVRPVEIDVALDVLVVGAVVVGDSDRVTAGCRVLLPLVDPNVRAGRQPAAVPGAGPVVVAVDWNRPPRL